MKKLLLIIILGVFVGYLYNLGLQNGKIEQARIEMTNKKIDISINNKENDGKIDNKQDVKIDSNDNKENEKSFKEEDLYNLDNVSYEKKLVGTEENGIFMGLPEGPLFGQSISLENGKITYSNIDSLEIEKKEFDINNLKESANIWNTNGTGYLNSKEFSSYVYWNSLRPIDFNNKESGNSFYVLEKKDDKFIYSKLYFDFNHKLFGRLKIKEFEVDEDKNISKQMATLNQELKEKNKDFESVKKTDFLFKEIVR